MRSDERDGIWTPNIKIAVAWVNFVKKPVCGEGWGNAQNEMIVGKCWLAHWSCFYSRKGCLDKWFVSAVYF